MILTTQLLIEERKILYIHSTAVYVPLKGPKKRDTMVLCSLLGHPIYTQSVVWTVSCPYMYVTGSALQRGPSAAESLHIHFLVVPHACVLIDQVLALHLMCALLCNGDNMTLCYCHMNCG